MAKPRSAFVQLERRELMVSSEIPLSPTTSWRGRRAPEKLTASKGGCGREDQLHLWRQVRIDAIQCGALDQGVGDRHRLAAAMNR